MKKLILLLPVFMLILALLMPTTSVLAYPQYDSKHALIINETKAFDGIHNYTDNYVIFPFNTNWLIGYDYVGSNTSYSFNISTSALFTSNLYNYMSLEGYNGTDWVELNQINCNGSVITNQTINITDAQPYVNASGYMLIRFTWMCDQIGQDTCDSADGRIYEVFTIPDSLPPTPTSPLQPLGAFAGLAGVIVAAGWILFTVRSFYTTKMTPHAIVGLLITLVIGATVVAWLIMG